MSNPIKFFFSIGDKITKGDIKRKADWDYYLLWIMFMAFFSVMIDNFYLFYLNLRLSNLGWGFVMLAIMWFQYYGLKSAYEMRNLIKASKDENKVEKEESIDEMLDKFK